MGTDIHSFVEYADDSGRGVFSGRPEEPAWLFGKFTLLRDYSLFDALGDGRNAQMAPQDVGKRSLFPPRGVPPDMSVEAAWEYYDLVVETCAPHALFWPSHGCVSVGQAQERVRQGARLGSVVQTMQFGAILPRTWRVIPKECWHTASWLTLPEIHQSLEHYRLPLTKLCWDFQALLKCLTVIEAQIGQGQTRLVFWFDN